MGNDTTVTANVPPDFVSKTSSEPTIRIFNGKLQQSIQVEERGTKNGRPWGARYREWVDVPEVNESTSESQDDTTL